MNALSPSIWYLIAIGLGLLGAAAAVVFFRGDSPDWIALTIALGGVGSAFSLVRALPKAPPRVLPIVALIASVLMLLDVVRIVANRWRRRRRGSNNQQGGPPDIERIP